MVTSTLVYTVTQPCSLPAGACNPHKCGHSSPIATRVAHADTGLAHACRGKGARRPTGNSRKSSTTASVTKRATRVPSGSRSTLCLTRPYWTSNNVNRCPQLVALGLATSSTASIEGFGSDRHSHAATRIVTGSKSRHSRNGPPPIRCGSVDNQRHRLTSATKA